MAHNARIGQQAGHVGVREPRHSLRIEACKGRAERLALAQDGDPGQPGLKPVENQLFPQRAAVALGHAPFFVMIGDIERV
jgi:hypothetical protein